MFSTSPLSSRDIHESNSPSGTLRLDEVPRQQFSELAEALKKYLPHSLNVLAMLTVDLRYGFLEHLEARVLSPQHPRLWGKVVVITPVATSRALRSLAVFWCESEVADDVIITLLQSLPQHCWTDPLMLRAVPSHLVPKLDEMIHTLSRGHLRAGIPNDVKVMILHGCPPPVTRLPEGYYVADIDPSYANQVLSKFVGRFTECSDGFAKCFKSLPASGVFFKKSKYKSYPTERTEYSSIKIEHIVSKPVSDSDQYAQNPAKKNVDAVFSQLANESSGINNEKLEERPDLESGQKAANEEVMAQSTEPSAINEEVVTQSTEPSPINEEVVTQSTEPSPINEEVVTQSTEPSPINEKVVTQSTEPSPINEEVVTQSTEPSPINEEVVTQSTEPSPINEEVVTQSTEPSPINEKVVTQSTEKPPINKEVVTQSAEPSAATSNMKISETRKPSATSLPSDGLKQSQAFRDELVSWIILKPGSDTGILYTLHEHRGRGLAKAAVLHLANRLFRDRQLNFSFVDYDNDVSFKLLQHLGFSEYTDMKICFYYPPGFTFADVIRQYSDNIPDDVKKYL